jgi:hypothetical protein
MSVDDNQCFGPCAKAGVKNPSAFLPATLVFAVAINRNPATDRIQQ